MIAFSTVCSSGYVDFFSNFLKSILKHNPEFSYDFYVFCDGRLEPDERTKLKSIYSGLIFKDVDNLLYEQHYKCSLKFYSFESFTLSDYDKVIYVDCDFICMQSIDELIETANGVEDIGMVIERRRGDCLPFNGGLIIIDKKYLNEGTRFELLNSDYNTLHGHLQDQKTYNYFFKDKIRPLHIKFNTLISEVDFVKRDEIVLLHYIFKPNTEAGRSRTADWQLEAYDEYSK